ncbi:MAG: copper amine oxidase N-terminal domain-containing protein, partial [Clostridia bacterium]|nr:copper amine oxidase N-terminal domain-containing protein [Clostridia bacterium]
SDVAYVNNNEVRLDSPAFLENDRTYTPVRFIAEALGASVSWDEPTQRVTITKNKK